jgi:hypothetical protein
VEEEERIKQDEFETTRNKSEPGEGNNAEYMISR